MAFLLPSSGQLTWRSIVPRALALFLKRLNTTSTAVILREIPPNLPCNMSPPRQTLSANARIELFCGTKPLYRLVYLGDMR